MRGRGAAVSHVFNNMGSIPSSLSFLSVIMGIPWRFGTRFLYLEHLCTFFFSFSSYVRYLMTKDVIERKL